MKKKQRNILIGIVLLALAILVITQINQKSLSIVDGQDRLRIISFQTFKYGVNSNPLAIAFSPNRPVKIGEQLYIIASQDLNDYCETLTGELKLKSASGTNWGSKFVPTTLNIGFSTLRVDYTVDTQGMPSGSYVVENTWKCNGQDLGSDGRLGGITTPEVSQFTILEEESPDNNQCRISSCAINQELTNPTSSACYCKDLWIEGDGVCSTGERATSVDCADEEEDCASSEILIGGQCISKSVVCIKDGGTKECVDDGTNTTKFPIIYISLIGGLALIGYWAYKKYGKRK